MTQSTIKAIDSNDINKSLQLNKQSKNYIVICKTNIAGLNKNPHN